MAGLYFAYASNMDPHTYRRRCPRAVPLGRARLPGYRLAFTRYSRQRKGGSADIVEDAACEVWGVLYEVDDTCIATMDRVEGVPTAYRRERVTVVDDAGDAREALTYVANKTGDFYPGRSYVEVILRGARAYALPDDYIATLERLKTV
ncbi:MAG: gamma-glutamylcyclotransferase [Dehalococcoidia bacterium]|nr:gamma-glutamylcyclotransferase [Dehalococcoidia bacterium]